MKTFCWTTSGANQSLIRSCLYIALCLGIQSCDKAEEPVTETRAQHVLQGSTMGTQYSIKLIDSNQNLNTVPIQTGIDSILQNINQVMSTYIDDSELSLLNQAAENQYHHVSNELFSVLTEAILISNITEGSFDVTVGPLINLWGFGADKQDSLIPATEAITTAKYHMGYHHINLMEDQSVRKNRPDMYIDLSAIAKGYAVDRVSEWLETQGYSDYMVEIGGELKASGSNQKNIVWQIGIEQPRPDGRAIQRVIPLDDLAMATSGDYRNYFEKNGIRYSHIIDPVSGKPIHHKLASVSVLHTSAATADALATAMLVMGPDKSLELAKKNNLAILMIIKNEHSEGFHEVSSPLFDEYTR